MRYNSSFNFHVTLVFDLEQSILQSSEVFVLTSGNYTRQWQDGTECKYSTSDHAHSVNSWLNYISDAYDLLG